jgi:hypothetical protein
MKKSAALSLSLLMVLCIFTSCGKKAETPQAGTATPDDMLKFIPHDANGVFFVDVNRAMQTEFVNKIIKEDENYAKYQEFIQETGFDPQKDIYYVAAALLKDVGEDSEGAAVINLKYDKEAIKALLMSKAEEEQTEILEEDYNGMSLLSWKEGAKDMVISFLDDSNILAGNAVGVRSIVDVIQKKKDNVFKNERLSTLLKDANKEAMIWGAMLISSEAVDKVKSGNPMLNNLEGINAASMYFDYKNRNLMTEIKVMSEDEEKNKQVAELLTGIKALGAMMATENPSIGKLMDKIEITSGADFVKLFASIPEEMLDELKTEMEKQD